MILRCIKLFHTILLSFIVSAGFSQFGTYKQEQLFLTHLAKEKLFNERIFLLNRLSDTSSVSSVLLEKAWTYHALGDLNLSRTFYSQAPIDSLYQSRFLSDYITLLFKLYEPGRIKELLQWPTAKEPDRDFDSENLMLGLKIYGMSFSSREIEYIDMPIHIKEIYRKNLSIQKKSGMLAGFYSVVIPGLGKAYYGKKRDALTALATNLLLGIQALESYQKAGPKSFRFVFFGTTFSLLYLSNIYGTLSGLTKAKRDWKNQLHHEVGYSYFNTGNTIYPAHQ